MNKDFFFKAFFVAVTALFLCGDVGVALAQDANARLNRLENEIQTLSRAVFRGETPPSPAQGGMVYGDAGQGSTPTDATLEVRISQIERDLATLTGRIEEQDYRLRQLELRLDQAPAPAAQAVSTTPAPVIPQLGAAQNGMNQMQVTPNGQAQGAPLATGAVNRTVIPAPQGMKTLGALTEGGEGADALYNEAFSLLKARDYDQAAAQFGAFLDRYPDHHLAENARYWRGETFYVRGHYESAARLFAEGYQKDPKGPKGPDNLLKLGLSLAGIGKKDDACLTFSQLLKDYDGAPRAILDRTETERQRLGCP